MRKSIPHTYKISRERPFSRTNTAHCNGPSLELYITTFDYFTACSASLMVIPAVLGSPNTEA